MDNQRYKKLTILHSNDMHGDFLAEVEGATGKLIGGLALLSGYLNQVRTQEANVLYVIAGDMVQGSVIDAEYKGVSTIEIMNYLAPDVVTLGNHELDYGLAHLLFLEKVANFPIVNSNLYIKQHNKRLLQPYIILERDGMHILFIGIIAEAVLSKLASDEIGTYITLEDAAAETGKICNAYRDSDIDLTVLLTHIGFEEDLKLAAMLQPEWGVDMIIGGHSHTLLENPARVNGILIAQAGIGTDQIGRFDITVDTALNAVAAWRWQLIPVDDQLAAPDLELGAFVDGYKQAVDQKYNRVLCRLAHPVEHSARQNETTLGNLLADILAQRSGADVVLLGSSSIRRPEPLGPVVTLGDLHKLFPYDGPVVLLTVTGAQLAHIFAFFMAPENHHFEGIIYQVNAGVQATYDQAAKTLESLTLDGQPIDPAGQYTLGVLEHHYKNAGYVLDTPHAALSALAPAVVVATSTRDVLEAYLCSHQHIRSEIEGRLVWS